MPSPNIDPKPPRLVVLGDGGVGKTSLVLRHVRDMFFEEYHPTLEAHYTADVKLPSGATVTIDITDTAGQEDFAPFRDLFIKEGNVFLVVYSVTEFSSLRSADELLQKVRDLQNIPVKFILVGNKCDLERDRQVARADAQAVADKHGGYFIETSAYRKTGMTELVQTLGTLLQPGYNGAVKKKTGKTRCKI
jgi:small GTP-binding protein